MKKRPEQTALNKERCIRLQLTNTGLSKKKSSLIYYDIVSKYSLGSNLEVTNCVITCRIPTC